MIFTWQPRRRGDTLLIDTSKVKFYNDDNEECVQVVPKHPEPKREQTSDPFSPDYPKYTFEVTMPTSVWDLIKTWVTHMTFPYLNPKRYKASSPVVESVRIQEYLINQGEWSSVLICMNSITKSKPGIEYSKHRHPR